MLRSVIQSLLCGGFLLLLSLSSTGCPSLASRTYSSTSAPTFPASWPMPGLTLPDGCYENPLGASTGATKLQTAIEKAEIDNNAGFLWIVGFRSEKDFSDIKAHIESCLDMTDFSQFRESNAEGRQVVDWKSADGKTRIQLFHSKKNMVNTSGGFRNYPGYSLTVTVLN